MNYEGMIVKWDGMWWYVYRQIEGVMYVSYWYENAEWGKEDDNMYEDVELVEDYVDTSHLTSKKALQIAWTLERFE